MTERPEGGPAPVRLVQVRFLSGSSAVQYVEGSVTDDELFAFYRRGRTVNAGSEDAPDLQEVDSMQILI